MELTWMQKNSDGTINIDFYNDFEDYTKFEECVQMVPIAKQKENKEIRNHPFYFGTCEKCGHPILTNRDTLDYFECMNCHETVFIKPDETDKAKKLAEKFNQSIGAEIEEIKGIMISMLIWVPEEIAQDETKLRVMTNILSSLDFFPMPIKNDEFFSELQRIGETRGWTEKNSQPMISCRTLIIKGDDILYNGEIPRVEEAKRVIKRVLGTDHVLVLEHEAELTKDSFHQLI